MAELDQLYTALRNADKAGDTASAAKLAAYIKTQGTAEPKIDYAKTPLVDQIPGGKPQKPVQDKPRGLADYYLGPADAALSIGANAIAGPVAAAGGVVRSLTGGKYGTQEGVKQGERFANRLQAAAYQPRTETGRDIVGKVGAAVNDSGVVGIPFGEGLQLGRAMSDVKPAIAAKGAAVADKAATGIADRVVGAIPKKPDLVGVGAMKTPESTIRDVRAKSLPVPVNLTLGQKTRDFNQLKFEKETAKLPEAGRLRERFADQNEAVLKNFDAFDDLTGSQSRSLRDVGKLVNEALVERSREAKGRISAAYTKAKVAGEMEAPVPIKPLQDYLEKNRSAMRNAPVLGTVRAELKRLAQDKGEITLNDMEELRKTIGKAANMATPDAKYAPELKALIDQSTEGKGGDLYKQARTLHSNFSKEFKDKAAVAKLLRNKPGTTDRAVAFEDVFNHAILDGSLDDVKAVGRTLKKAGPSGQEAWRELQGQAIRNMKEEVTKSATLDDRGNRIVSPAALDKIVKSLDRDGKLDYLYGKKGAEQIRTVNDIAKDVYTSPPGTVNHSNTASVLAGLLDTALTASFGGHVPLPVATTGMYAVKKVKSKILGKKIDAALDDPIPPRPEP